MGARHRVGMASIIVSVLLMGGCKPASDATQAPEAPTSTVNAEHELVDDMQGVWATTNGSGTATAASFAAFGLGEETWSSGRAPATNNALCAYTPSRGVISVRGN